MSYAQIVAGIPVALAPARAVSFERDGAIINASYETVMRWSDDERAAIGVYPIVDDEIPGGKIVAGSTLESDGGVIRRRWTLEDAPPPPVPGSVSRLQGRLALLDAGLLATVEAAVNAAGGATLIWYQDAQNWRRDDPILNGLGTAIGLSEEDKDDLFRAAVAVAA